MSTQFPQLQEPPASLSQFLRGHRMALAPERAGIRRPGGRQGVGLRRAEVAELANISVAYYTFIERGRDLRPSRSVLDALGRALQMSANDRRLLRDLAAGTTRHTPLQREDIDVGVGELTDLLEPNPSYVMGARWDILASNRSANRLFADWANKPARDRNLLRYYLCDPAARELFVDWQAEAADQLAHFREYYARRPDDPAYISLLESIFADTPPARDWWERHDAQPNRSGRKRIRLPDGTVVLLRQLILQTADNPEIQVVTYFADGDDEDLPADELDPGT
ncbi:MAG: helix-turn-helix transcriptional regulator [Lapillicoccus sp.]